MIFSNVPDAVCVLPILHLPMIKSVCIMSRRIIFHTAIRVRELVNSLYHSVRRHTLSVKFHLIEKFTGLKMGHHLDIGAGTGAFVQYMNEHGWKSQGIEPDDQSQGTCHGNIIIPVLLPSGMFEIFCRKAYDAS